MATNASLREPSAKKPVQSSKHLDAQKARAKKLVVKAAREKRAAKAPLNTSTPELAAAQLARLDRRFGKNQGAADERAKLEPVAAQLKPAPVASNSGTRRGRRRRKSA